MNEFLRQWFGAHLRVPDAKHALHHIFHAGHGVYFGSVVLEGHGLYAGMGGFMLVMLTLNYFLHFD